MRPLRWIAIATLLCLLLPAAANADPKRSFGIFLGDSSFTNETATGGTPETYDSGGFTFGFDLQLPQGSLTSLNFIYMASIGSSTFTNETPAEDPLITQSELGIQYRIWPTDFMFIAAHVGIFQQALTFVFLPPQQGIGVVYGGAAGFEFDAGTNYRMSLSAHYDRAPSVSVVDNYDPSDITGLTVLVGIRFNLRNN